MKSLIDWLAVGLLALCVVAIAPATAFAGPQDEEGDDEAEEESGGDDEGEAEEDEGDSDEDAAEDAEEDAEEDTAALFGDDEELPSDSDAEEEEQVTEEPKLLQGTWTKKFIFQTDDGKFKFQPRGWLQPRLGINITPDAPYNPGGAPHETLAGTGFTFKRARFGFQAYMFDILRVYLDTGWASSGGPKLVDYFLEINPFDGIAVLQAGYFRPYLGRQLLMGTTTLQMIEYAQAWQDPTLGLGLGRDHGVGVHGMVAKGVEYGIGIWDGEGMAGLDGGVTENGVPYPGNIDFAFGGRIAIHPLAFTDVGVAVPLGDESDTKVSTKPGLVIGGAVMYNKRHNQDIFEPTTALYQLYYDSQLKIGGELGFKFKGITFQGEFFMHKVTVADDAHQLIKDAVDLENANTAENLNGTGIGFYTQLGYFIEPINMEIAARFDMVDESTDLRGSRIFPGLGLTYYIFGNNLKAQFMYRLNHGLGYGNLEDAAGNPMLDAAGNEIPDPGTIPTSHNVFLMLQAAI